MKNFGKIVGINLAAILVYSALIRLYYSSTESQDRVTGIMMFSAIAVCIHVGVCLLIMIGSFLSRDNAGGLNWLGAAGTVLLIGFSVCLGNGALG